MNSGLDEFQAEFRWGAKKAQTGQSLDDFLVSFLRACQRIGTTKLDNGKSEERYQVVRDGMRERLFMIFWVTPYELYFLIMIYLA